MKIAIISGSPRQESVTFRLALHLQKALQTTTIHQIDLIDTREQTLVAGDSVISRLEAAPEAHKSLSAIMFEADAFIMVTPEYNGSYTASLKNLFDHFPKQQHKAFGIVTASTGALGGIRAAMQMQQYVYALFGIGSPFMLVTPQVDKKFAPDGTLLDETFQKSIDTFLTELLWLTEKISS